MKSTSPLAVALEHISIPELSAIAEGLLAKGQSSDEVVAHIVALVDAAIPFALIIPGPVGLAIEAVDGPIFVFIARSAVRLAQRRQRAATG